jgi:hypothetical protein
MERFAAPARREFFEQTVPGIAERFAGEGGLSSSAFQQALGQAGAGLSERLTAMREQLRPQTLSALQGFGQMGMGTKPFGYQTTAAQPGFLQSMLGSTIGGLGRMGATMLG